MTKTMDPAMARIFAAMQLVPKIDLRTLPIATARQTFLDQQVPWAWCPHPLAEIRAVDVPGPAGAMRGRLYRPAGTGLRPIIVFAHGGGWTFGDIDTHGGTMHWLAAVSGCAVLGFDYRLAPEHPFPAGHEDTLAAIAFARSGALGAECDTQRIALAGDSAGANLSLGAMLALRDGAGAQVDTACLFYGCFGPDFSTESHRENGTDFGLTSEMMRWYWNNFLGNYSDATAPAACAPLHADVSGLPPLYLNAAGLDPLLDDTTILSARLARAGVRHRVDIFPGVVHGFLRLARELPLAQTALIAAGTYLKDFFNETKPS